MKYGECDDGVPACLVSRCELVRGGVCGCEAEVSDKSSLVAIIRR